MILIPRSAKSQPVSLVDLEYSVGGRVSDGVYRGSVSTESGPWCLPIEGGGYKMGSVA